MDLQRICRLCTFRLHKPRNIFTTRGLLEKISKFTDIQIRKGDGLPSSICDLCDLKLQITDEFRQEVKEADNLIRSVALKRIAKLSNDSRKSAASGETILEHNRVSQGFETGSYLGRSLGADLNRRREISRERMRVSENVEERLIKDGKFRNGIGKQSSIHSYATARSLVASYEALINRCGSRRFTENFTFPSSVAESETEIEGGEAFHQEVRKFLPEKITLTNITRSSEKFDGDSRGHANWDATNPRVPFDPLDLLRVKKIRPLDNEEGYASSTDNFVGPRSSEIVSRRPGVPSFPRDDEGPEDQSPTRCSSSSNNFRGETRPSTSSSPGPPLTQKIINSSSSGSKPICSSNPTGSRKDGLGGAQASGYRTRAEQCPICDRMCLNSRGLKVHFRVHRAVRCQICNARTETKEKYRDHIQIHVKPIETDATFGCLICKNVFKTNTGLNAHMRIHCKSVPVFKKCSHCEKSFPTLRGYKIHLKKSHNGYETE